MVLYALDVAVGWHGVVCTSCAFWNRQRLHHCFSVIFDKSLMLARGGDVYAHVYACVCVCKCVGDVCVCVCVCVCGIMQ